MREVAFQVENGGRVRMTDRRGLENASDKLLDLTDPFAGDVIQVAPDVRAWHLRERKDSRAEVI